MPKLLIIGSTGFIGKHLCLKAKSLDYTIIAATRTQSKLAFLHENQIPNFKFTLDNKALLQKELLAFREEYGKPDYIIYNVGCTQSLTRSDYHKVNYQYLKNFIESLQAIALYPNKFLFTSSLSVHHPISRCGCAFINENDDQNPITTYGRSKMKAEEYLNSISNFPILIVRPTAVYGPGDLNFLGLIKSIKNHIEIYPVRKDQSLSLIFIDDLVDAYYLLLQNNNAIGAYLISDGKAYNIGQLYTTIKKILGSKTIKLVIPYSMLKFLAWNNEIIDRIKGKASIFNREKVNDLAAESWVCDTYKLQKEIAFKPKYSLEMGMQKTIKWYQDNEYI